MDGNATKRENVKRQVTCWRRGRSRPRFRGSVSEIWTVASCSGSVATARSDVGLEMLWDMVGPALGHEWVCDGVRLCRQVKCD